MFLQSDGTIAVKSIKSIDQLISQSVNQSINNWSIDQSSINPESFPSYHWLCINNIVEELSGHELNLIRSLSTKTSKYMYIVELNDYSRQNRLAFVLSHWYDVNSWYLSGKSLCPTKLWNCTEFFGVRFEAGWHVLEMLTFNFLLYW